MFQLRSFKQYSRMSFLYEGFYRFRLVRRTRRGYPLHSVNLMQCSNQCSNIYAELADNIRRYYQNNDVMHKYIINAHPHMWRLHGWSRRGLPKIFEQSSTFHIDETRIYSLGRRDDTGILRRTSMQRKQVSTANIRVYFLTANQPMG